MAEFKSKLPPLTEERISLYWVKVDRRGPDECWLWKASLSGGYGQFRTGRGKDRSKFGAHRVAYFLEHGVDPVDFFVCHKCDVRACCNPAHLFLGSHLDNVRDAISKGRFASGDNHHNRIHPERMARGERAGGAKLKASDVVEIRALYATGLYFYREIGDMFGVSWSRVFAIVHRKSWVHVV